MYNQGKYELVVRFRSSEDNPPAAPTNTIHAWSKQGSESGSGSRIREAHKTYGESTTMPPSHRSTPKSSLYTCVDYRIENGALFITESVGSHEGFIIPLDVIQEITVRNAPVEKASELPPEAAIAK